MEKIAIGSNLPKNLVDLDNSVEKNISLLAEAKNTTPDKITACVLDRPRHDKIISSLKKMNVDLKLISDGDVSGIIYIVDKNSPVDVYMGIGGGPEGVLAAAALSCYGGQIQTRLVLDSDESVRAKKMGITDLKRKYAKNCILARKLIEKGVRVVQLFNGSDPSGGNGITNWDSHSDIAETHAMQAEIMDQPTATLIRDLKRRGLLEQTLIVWATEFGRMPFLQGNGTGRDHNPNAFTCFLAAVSYTHLTLPTKA